MSEQTTQINFSPFVGEQDSRYSATRPFIHSGAKYATDGRIIIAVPTDGPDEPPESFRVNELAGLPWYRFNHEASRFAPPEESEAIAGKDWCSGCDGQGFIGKECLACDGDGCGHCRNTGFDDNARKCPDCDGKNTVLVDDMFRRLDGVLVPSRNYHAVRALPGVEISTHPKKTKTHPILFRADGGIRGMVMPCDESKVAELNHQPEQDTPTP